MSSLQKSPVSFPSLSHRKIAAMEMVSPRNAFGAVHVCCGRAGIRISATTVPFRRRSGRCGGYGAVRCKLSKFQGIFLTDCHPLFVSVSTILWEECSVSNMNLGFGASTIHVVCVQIFFPDITGRGCSSFLTSLEWKWKRLQILKILEILAWLD